MHAPLTAEVRSVSAARDAVGGLMHHMVASIRVILLDQLATGGTLLRAARYLPGFKRVVVSIGSAPHPFVPGLLASHTEELSAVRALHSGHAVHVQREIDEIATENTPHTCRISS